MSAELSPSLLLHLKAPTEGHDHNARTLCGLDDPGVYAYASATNAEYVMQLKRETESEPYPLCPNCESAYTEG